MVAAITFGMADGPTLWPKASRTALPLMLRSRQDS